MKDLTLAALAHQNRQLKIGLTLCGEQTQRVFVGKTRGESSAVILADAKGAPKIMMLVTPEGYPMLNFLNNKG
jgi:hypothetical protein